MKKLTSFFLTFLVLALLSQGVTAKNTELKWSKIPMSRANWFYNVTYGNGTYVAVGSKGYLLISKDGSIWKKVDAGINCELKTIVYNGKIFVSGGQYGTILTSKDGEHWIKRLNDLTSDINGLAWNGKYFLASDGYLAKSTDGITWTNVTSNSNLPDYNYALYWTGKEFIYAGAFNRSENPGIFFSGDGVNWVQKLEAKTIINSVAYNGKTYVAVGKMGYVVTSSDGKTWKERSVNKAILWPANANLKSIIWTGDSFIAVGYDELGFMEEGTDSIIITSKDGINWTQMPHTQKEYLNGICKGKNAIVAVGSYGAITRYTKEDGWSKIPMPDEYDINDITYNGRQYFAVANYGKLLSSDDCINWSEVQIKKQKEIMDTSSYHLSSIVWNGDKMVIVGSNCYCMVSTDGEIWEESKIETDTNDTLINVIWNGRQFVAISVSSYGQKVGAIYTSPDAVTWTKVLSKYKEGLFSPTASPTVTVVLGNNGKTILTSLDGQEWLEKAAPSAIGFNMVYYDGKYFIATDTETTYYSKDGINWKNKEAILPQQIKKIVWNGKKYAGVYYDSRKKRYSIAFSNNGIDWKYQSLSINVEQIDEIIWDGKKYIAAFSGKSVMIATSKDGLKWDIKKDLGKDNNVNEIVKTEKLYIASANNGILLTSADGLSWTYRKSGTTLDLYSTAWDGKKYLAVGGKYGDQVAITSKDGLTWSKGTPDVSFTFGNPSQLIWNGKQFLLIRDGGVSVSKDGSKWTQKSTGINQFRKVLWNGSFYIGITGEVSWKGRILTSKDGLKWVVRASVDPCDTYFSRLNDIVWNGKNYVATAIEDNFTSTDGVNWKKIPFGGSGTFSHIASDDNGYIAADSSGHLFTSIDGEKWEYVSECAKRNTRFVVCAGGKYIAICDDGLLVGEWR